MIPRHLQRSLMLPRQALSPERSGNLEHISSSSNARLRSLRRWSSRAQRERDRVVVVEGEDLVHAALDAACVIRFLLIDASRIESVSELLTRVDESLVCLTTTELLGSVSELAHPPRTIAVFERPPSHTSIPAGMARVVLDAVHDPGNVGTVVRSATALGVAVVLLPGCADPWSGKALRAAMGATFRAMLMRSDSCASACRDNQQVIALDARATRRLWEIEIESSSVFIVGGERDGISSAADACASERAMIPFADASSDSLNAGVAASLAMYEWARQNAQEISDD